MCRGGKEVSQVGEGKTVELAAREYKYVEYEGNGLPGG